MTIQTEDILRQKIWETVHRAPIYDLHTHIYDARFNDLLLWGIDELLTYHYLVAEVFRYVRMDYDHFFSLSKREQADLVWQKVFIENSPVSEAARGVLTTLGMLGLDPSSRDLNAYRAYFAAKTPGQHIDDVFRVANLEAVVMTNDPFDNLERPVWEAEGARDPRFQAALRLDGLLMNWSGAVERLKGWGYAVKKGLDKKCATEVCRFLKDWAEKINPLYMAVSLSDSFDPQDNSDCSRLLEKCVLPVCRELNLPMALMIGVRRQVNPGLRLAGDAVAKASIDAVYYLCAEYPHNKFMMTMLSRENQHELVIAARKFANFLPFGCWWFLNDPYTINEMTRMRVELLGLSHVPQHSDARVLDQVIYKWAHSRWLIALVLQDKYCDLHRTGWRLTEAEIARDVHNLFSGNFKRFLDARFD